MSSASLKAIIHFICTAVPVQTQDIACASAVHLGASDLHADADSTCSCSQKPSRLLAIYIEQELQDFDVWNSVTSIFKPCASLELQQAGQSTHRSGCPVHAANLLSWVASPALCVWAERHLWEKGKLKPGFLASGTVDLHAAVHSLHLLSRPASFVLPLATQEGWHTRLG